MRDDRLDKDRPLAREPGREPADPTKERLATHAAPAATGAVAGATAGAVSGIALGPVGSLVGAAAGALAGAAAGAATGPGSAVDPAPFLARWREAFASRPYAVDARFEDYEPAYRFAVEQYLQTDHPLSWESAKDRLCVEWSREKARTGLAWDRAMPAIRDAWRHLYDPEGATPAATM